MQPVPPARRTATLPNISTPVGAPAPTPTAAQLAAAQQHHRSLVAHYWNFARQGFAAPLTAVKGSEERRRQEVARTEAVEWARQCGIFVVDPAAPPPPAAIAPGPVSTPAAPTFVPQGIPTPLASASTAAAVPSYGHPLPSAPLPPTGAAPTPSTASMASAPAVPCPQQFTQASSPSAAQAGPRPLPTPQTGPPRLPPNPQRSRPLPVPPPARSSAPPNPHGETSSNSSQLEARLDQLHLLGEKDSAGEQERNDARASSPAVPTVVLPGGVAEPSDGPKAPTFSFSVDGDEADGPAASPAPPAIPSFSFACYDEQDTGQPEEAAASSPARSSPAARRGPARPPPLHPRFDPSHPSHRLYHPTSVMSPLSPDGTAHPTAGGSVVQPDAGMIACSGCSQLIFGRVLFALGKSWHPDCFRCAEEGCGAKLEVMEFEGTPEEWEEEEDDGEGEGEEGEKESLRGKAWCMVHFEERFALECHHCHTPIASADYIPIADPALPPASTYRHTSTRYYHPLHFFCAGCGDPFIDPVQYESRAAGDDAPLEAKPYFAHEGHPYCDRCDVRMWRPKCPGCRKGVREEDGFLELPEEEGGGKWHEGCFRCSLCDKPLTGVYLVRKPTEDAPAGSDPETEPAGGQTNDGEETEVALPYCVECFDRVDDQAAV